MMEMEKDVGLSAAATPLARGNEMILAYMERVMKSLDVAIEGGNYRECAYSAQTMQCLHSELRKSAATQCARDDYSGDKYQKLCACMVKIARKANSNSGPFYWQLQGVGIALGYLGIPCNVEFNQKTGKHTSVTVGGITMDVDSSE